MILPLLFTLAYAPLAAGSLDDDAAFQAAVSLYHDVELERAADSFTTLLGSEWPAEERARIFAWHGLTLAQLGRAEQAKASFTSAALLDPAVQLPAPAPPKIEQLLEEARAEALASSPPPPEEDAEVPPPPAPSSEEPRPLPWLQIGGGGVALLGLGVSAGGGALAALSFNTEQQAYDADYADDASSLADAADLQRAIGATLAIVGVAVIGGGAALAFIPLE